ncbi:MAG: response regulator [Candidatus Altiarchaeales archaeon]|nr:response regulator [Candidatus Altiarchaeales archaeon]
MVKKILEEEGYKVEVADDGRGCMSSLEKKIPDLVLLDMMLPDMSGWDIFNKIINYEIHHRATYKNKDKIFRIKVAFLSVIPISENRLTRLRRYGVSDYIMKPFDNKDLVTRINKIFTEIL